MAVLHARQRVDAGLDARLRQVPDVGLLLADLRVDVVDADHQAGALLLLHHGRLELHIAGLPVHHETVAQREDAAVFDLRQDIFFRECREEAVHVLREDEAAALLPRIGEEIRALLRQPEALIAVGRAELPVAPALRVHDVDAEIVAGQGVDA